MIRQNKTKLYFILGGALVLTLAVAGCNNGETKEVKKDSVTTKTIIRDSIDTMEKMTGKKAPGSDPKPQ